MTRSCAQTLVAAAIAAAVARPGSARVLRNAASRPGARLGGSAKGGNSGRAIGLGAALLVLPPATAMAFPLIDPSNQDQVPVGTELAAPDAQALQHQLQLVDGLAAPLGGGWTILPRLDAQEVLTDNVRQTNTPRQWDLSTFLSPGIAIAGSTPRLQLSLDYAPTLSIYPNAGSLNSLTQQANGTALVTVVPEWLFLDARALAGVSNLNGGIGGLGTVGASAAATADSAATLGSLGNNSVGLSRDNEVQTQSFIVSPYLLHRFSDYGTAKLGYSAALSRSNTLNGFATSPFSADGADSQTQVTNEEIAHYSTDELLGALQDNIDIDLQQSHSSGSGTVFNPYNGLPGQNFAGASNNSNATRAIFTDRLDYVVNHAITVFISGGHEHITYSGFGLAPIDDLTWNVGTTLTPNTSSRLTVSYGHLNGTNAFAADGYYAVTPRTTLTVSYSNTLGTQLEGLQNQLNLASVNGRGALVNAQTGGALFGGSNALAVQNGVFRTDTLAVGGRTLLNRDSFYANLFLIRQTQLGAFAAPSSTSKTASLQWLHALQPDLTLSAAASFSQQDQGANGGLNPGNSRSVAASVALQYQISETLAASLRYTFFDRRSDVAAFSFYQNALILGLSKSF